MFVSYSRLEKNDENSNSPTEENDKKKLWIYIEKKKGNRMNDNEVLYMFFFYMRQSVMQT